MDLRELVARIARDQGWKTRGAGGPSGLEVPLARGRSQFVEVAEFEDAGRKMVRFTTRIGKVVGLGEGRLRAALEVNLRLPHGCLAVDGADMVLTETCRLDATASRASGEMLEFLARQADAYERFIFGSDTH